MACWAAFFNMLSFCPAASSAGTLAGVRLPSGTTAFLGVPYAAPPVGPRRFAAPDDEGDAAAKGRRVPERGRA